MTKLYVRTRATFDEINDPELLKPEGVSLLMQNFDGKMIHIRLSVLDAIKIGHQLQVAAISGFVQSTDYDVTEEEMS